MCLNYTSGNITNYLFLFQRAANIDHGHWTAPYFDCDGLVKMWKITYASPFFGWDSLRQRIEFKYVLLNLVRKQLSLIKIKYFLH